MPELQESAPEKVPALRGNPGKCLFKNTGFVIIEFKYIQAGPLESGLREYYRKRQSAVWLVLGVWCIMVRQLLALLLFYQNRPEDFSTLRPDRQGVR